MQWIYEIYLAQKDAQHAKSNLMNRMSSWIYLIVMCRISKAEIIVVFTVLKMLYTQPGYIDCMEPKASK